MDAVNERRRVRTNSPDAEKVPLNQRLENLQRAAPRPGGNRLNAA